MDMAHLTIAQVRKRLGKDESFRSFGFVRDPYARFVSSYLHLKRWSADHRALTLDELVFDSLRALPDLLEQERSIFFRQCHRDHEAS